MYEIPHHDLPKRELIGYLTKIYEGLSKTPIKNQLTPEYGVITRDQSEEVIENLLWISVNSINKMHELLKPIEEIYAENAKLATLIASYLENITLAEQTEKLAEREQASFTAKEAIKEAEKTFSKITMLVSKIKDKISTYKDKEDFLKDIWKVIETFNELEKTGTLEKFKENIKGIKKSQIKKVNEENEEMLNQINNPL
ncbi:MAG: hypothetical protein Q6362_000530 [Candidatus Wukongarchaeota archaeon]|nr:hypothetical protein [Candidatus Wukongarchaeota archaeon]